MIRRRITAIFLALSALTALAVTDYSKTAERADRAFEYKEWPNAAALYGLMLNEQPQVSRNYGRAIVAYSMCGDTASCVNLFERAMAHGVPVDSLFNIVRQSSFEIAQGDVYSRFLHRCRNAAPWMGRAIDDLLLEWYLYRSDGPMIIKYAQTMLNGLPDSKDYLNALATGYIDNDQPYMAAETWQKVLELYPDDYQTLINLGNVYLELGDESRAHDYLGRAYKLHPTPYLNKK
jgi:tetratricopeptide (TPR) repeat protein